MSRSIFSSISSSWATPRSLYAALDAEFKFTLDPCPLDGDVDGLSPLFVRWSGERVFCNPPYGPHISDWLKRASEPEVAVYLLPARTDTRWFHCLVLPAASEIRFLRGRLHFGDGPGRATFPSMIVVYRNGKGADPKP